MKNVKLITLWAYYKNSVSLLFSKERLTTVDSINKIQRIKNITIVI